MKRIYEQVMMEEVPAQPPMSFLLPGHMRIYIYWTRRHILSQLLSLSLHRRLLSPFGTRGSLRLLPCRQDLRFQYGESIFDV